MAYSKKKIKRELGAFIKGISRKRQKGCEPNDRHYDGKIEEKLKRMKPEDIQDIFYGEDD